MILNFAVNTNSFAYCSVYQSQQETTTYVNSGDGHYHQAIYIMEGSSTATEYDSEQTDVINRTTQLETGVLYDIADSRDKYIVTTTAATGCSMAMFNPIPAFKTLDIKILKDAQTLNITSDNQRTTVVCLTGPITVKDKVLKSMQYAVVFANTSTTLTMTDNTVCAVVVG